MYLALPLAGPVTHAEGVGANGALDLLPGDRGRNGESPLAHARRVGAESRVAAPLRLSRPTVQLSSPPPFGSHPSEEPQS